MSEQPYGPPPGYGPPSGYGSPGYGLPPGYGPPGYGPPAGYGPPSGYWQPAGRVGRPTSAAVQITLTVITFGIWSFVWVYRQHRDIRDYSGTGIGGGVGLLIYFLVHIVTFFLLPWEVEGLYQNEGQRPPVSVVTGFWWFLPLIGWLIWYLKVQRALNEFWYAHGAPLA